MGTDTQRTLHREGCKSPETQVEVSVWLRSAQGGGHDHTFLFLGEILGTGTGTSTGTSTGTATGAGAGTGAGTGTGTDLT